MSSDATAATVVAEEFRFFAVYVVRAERLGPSMVRVTFGGEQLRDFAGGGRDQSLSLFLPHPGQREPVVPTSSGNGWYAHWRQLPVDVRAVMRSYTARAHRPEQGEVDVDFVLHGVGTALGAAGPASVWAARARPGDRAVLLGPAVEDNRGVGFRPPGDADWVLVAGDETALPAVGGILAWLPPGLHVRVLIEVPHARDIQDLPTVADVQATWLVRAGARGAGSSHLVATLCAAEFPAGKPYAWIAGESGLVKTLRRHLVRDRGWPRQNVRFAGYWRRGASEEDIRA
ncbi:siderophore-interacting protein [Amycolatopsis taiwanensis]|uniref:siderophore-interacting protein n=1 Tax=Amycolatopsis taiwanensis TaxID=342230 RepID=UPI0004878D62|nr:siderophore-interacting protein [Amycolatopsis taiwanensis]